MNNAAASLVVTALLFGGCGDHGEPHVSLPDGEASRHTLRIEVVLREDGALFVGDDEVTLPELRPGVERAIADMRRLHGVSDLAYVAVIVPSGTDPGPVLFALSGIGATGFMVGLETAPE